MELPRPKRFGLMHDCCADRRNKESGSKMAEPMTMVPAASIRHRCSLQQNAQWTQSSGFVLPGESDRTALGGLHLAGARVMESSGGQQRRET